MTRTVYVSGPVLHVLRASVNPALLFTQCDSVASVFDLCSPSLCPLRRWTLERFAAVLCLPTLASCTDGQSIDWP